MREQNSPSGANDRRLPELNRRGALRIAASGLVACRAAEPVGRIHFAGSFADNLPWGMDAATGSANRTAAAIDAL
jgi:hypothetical protein